MKTFIHKNRKYFMASNEMDLKYDRKTRKWKIKIKVL